MYLDYFIVELLEDVKSAMYIYSMKGEKLCKVPIDIGTVGAISCKRKHAEIFFSFTSFLSPGQIFKLDISDPKNAKTELYRETVVGKTHPARVSPALEPLRHL